MPAARDRKGHLECLVTLTYKVTPEGHAIAFDSISFPLSQKNMKSKMKSTL